MKKITALLLATILVFALTSAGFTSAFAADLTTIKVGASSTPHGEILELVKDRLAEEGYDLQIVIYDDYILPNTALEDGDLDANYFLGLDTDDTVAKIAFTGGAAPKVGTRTDRTVTAIEGTGTLTKTGAGKLTVGSLDSGITVLDIVDDGGYKISAVNAETIPAQLKNSNEGTIAVINYNYALAGGFKISDAIAIEDASGDAAQTYGNIVAVKEGNEENPAVLALVAALQDGAVEAFNEATGAGIVAVSEAV